MGKDWDRAVPSIDIWKECLRVLKPGAWCLVMSAPRQDVLSRMIVNLEDAGFEMGFSSLYHVYASGFPKASSISKIVDKRNNRTQNTYKPFANYLKKKRIEKDLSMSAIDKMLGTNTAYSWWEGRLSGIQLPSKYYYLQLKEILNLDNRFDELIERKEAEREIIGEKIDADGKKRSARMPNIQKNSTSYNLLDTEEKRNKAVWETKPATDQAKVLDGSYAGMQMKPALEVILVCMKPLSEKSYVDQALKNGKGITWLDDCRIPLSNYDKEEYIPKRVGWKNGINYKQPYNLEPDEKKFLGVDSRKGKKAQTIKPYGRFPANLLVSDGVLDNGKNYQSGGRHIKTDGGKSFYKVERNIKLPLKDSGSFSRYFSLDEWNKCARETFPFMIIPKASKSERNKGLGKGKKNIHETVKPVKLFKYLITLTTRTGDIVLDPFIGSGTTAVACKILNRKYIGIEINQEYCDIAEARIKAVKFKKVQATIL